MKFTEFEIDCLKYAVEKLDVPFVFKKGLLMKLCTIGPSDDDSLYEEGLDVPKRGRGRPKKEKSIEEQFV